MGSIYYNGDTHDSPSIKSHTSISRDTSKIQFSLQPSSVTSVDTAVYYCARDTVMGVHVSPDSSHPPGDPNPPGACGTHEHRAEPRSRCPGAGGDSWESLCFPLPAQEPTRDRSLCPNVSLLAFMSHSAY